MKKVAVLLMGLTACSQLFAITTSRFQVGNLSPKTTTERLQEKFSEAGCQKPHATMIKDRRTGEFTGFATVDCGKKGTDAKSLIQALNGSKIEGETIAVSEIQPRPFRSAEGRWR